MKGFIRALARLFRRPFEEDDGEQFQYVAYHDVAEFIEKGWVPEGVMPGHHGDYSVLMRLPKDRSAA
jgi:hypothetical protein